MQILGAVWQAVLHMIPDERDCDFQMVKQVFLVGGIGSRMLLIMSSERNPGPNILNSEGGHL